MSDPAALAALYSEYRALGQRSPSDLSQPQWRALNSFIADRGDERDAPAPRAARWAQRLLEVERFAQQYGRLPRQNNRRPQSGSEEYLLAEWLRNQRRADRRGSLDDYQRRRLACLDGYDSAPIESGWERRLRNYEQFLRAHARAPRVRSEVESERRLAAWAAKQRLAYRAGNLAHARIATLEALPVWAWGESPKN